MKRSTQTLFLLVAIVFSGCVNKTPLSVQKNGPPISTGVAEEVPISFTSMPTVVPVVTVEPSASATSEKLWQNRFLNKNGTYLWCTVVTFSKSNNQFIFREDVKFLP
ncbi:MAG: hypothetical protein WCK35_19970, partial [Chloroflexota bacterium]